LYQGHKSSNQGFVLKVQRLLIKDAPQLTILVEKFLPFRLALYHCWIDACCSSFCQLLNTMPIDPLANLMDSLLDLASPRRAGLSGKLGAVGGFQEGLPASSNQAHVGLLCLEYLDMRPLCFVG
jgi:hypothetical protein